MDEVGTLLTQLPMPIGPIVTGLLPVAAIAGFSAAFWAQYKRRTALMVVALAVAVLSLLGSIAFISAASAPS
jgi:hypothetical protein